MSESGEGGAPPKHDPLAALKQANFRFYIGSRISSGMSQALLQTVMAWQVYHISHSALDLGLLGLVRFFPALGVSMVGGVFADTYNRRRIVQITQTMPLTCGVILASATLSGWVSLELIFGLVLLMGLSSAFEGPARQALLVGVVRRETFPNAVTVESTAGQLGMTTGRAMGGIIIALAGVGTAYVIFTSLVVCAMLCMFFVHYEQTHERRAMTVESVKEGIRYVKGRQVILGAMALDMFAVIFGGIDAMLPIYATDILKVGGVGYGVLAASSQIGSFVMSSALVMRPPIIRAGRTLVTTIIAYGFLTILFGVSREFALSVILYMTIGAADQISVVTRRTMVQLATPDELRGRVNSVNQVFVSSSSQIGAMESGFVAAITSATFAVVSGGVGAIAVALLVAWRMPQLLNYLLPPDVARPRAAPETPDDEEHLDELVALEAEAPAKAL